MWNLISSLVGMSGAFGLGWSFGYGRGMSNVSTDVDYDTED